MLRAQFWTLAQRKCISKGVQKWTLSGSKVVSPDGSVFGPFIYQICWSFAGCHVRKISSFRGGNLELGRPVFASLVFLVFLGPKNRPFFVTGRSKSRPTPPWTPDLAQVHVTDPASPHCHPRKPRSKCKFLQSEDIFVKQLVAVRRVCVCAAAKNDYLTLQNHCVEGLQGTCPYLRNCGAYGRKQSTSDRMTMWSISLLLLPKNR